MPGTRSGGDRDRALRFSVADALVSTVDIDTHKMKVTRNGKGPQVIPITTGKAGFETRNGVKVIMSKERDRIMDAPPLTSPSGPESYRLKVEYAMRLTNSGEFLHAAPWSVASRDGRTSATAAPG